MTTGNPLADPAQWFTHLSLRSPFQEHFAGMPTLESDSLLVLSFLTPLTIAGDASIPLRLYADLAEDCPLGTLTPLIGAPESFDARDGNINNRVPVTLTTSAQGANLMILGPASSLAISGGPPAGSGLPRHA